MDSMEIDDDIYINHNLTMDGLTNRADFQRGKKPCSCTTLCLGLLCAVLMMGNIAQIIYYEIISGGLPAAPQQAALGMEHLQNESDALRADRAELQSSYASLTAERKQLEARLSNLSKEKDELQQNFSSASTQRDKFKASFTDLEKARDQLQVKFNALKQQSDQLRVNYDNMQRNLDSLQTIQNSVTATKDQLQAKYNNLQREKDNLQSRYWALMTNRDQFRSNYTSLKTDMDKLQKSYDSLKLSKNNLESTYNSLWRDKERLQSSYNSLWRTNSWLQANYSLLVADRAALQNKTDRLMEKLRDKPCKSGWAKFDFSCYFISTAKRNWTESRKACKAEGADLMVVNSKEEQVFINKKLKKGQNIWIGLTDSLMEGNWTWVDGSPLTVNFWQPGQPNSFNGNQDCVELVQTATTGEWNDDGCFADQNWICEL